MSNLPTVNSAASASLESMGTVVHAGLLDSFAALPTSPNDFTHALPALLNVAGPLSDRLAMVENSVTPLLAQGQALSSDAQTIVSDLLHNGISFQGLQSGDVTAALKSIAPLVGTLGTMPRIAMTVGLSAASGFAMGGPIGGAVGLAVGAGTAIYQSFTENNQLKITPPSEGAQANLKRLLSWGASQRNDFPEILGWHYYDMIARQYRMPNVTGDSNQESIWTLPICTPWIFGQATTFCSPSKCYTTFEVGMTQEEWTSKAVVEIHGTLMEGQTCTGDTTNPRDLFTIAVNRRIPPDLYSCWRAFGEENWNAAPAGAGCGSVNPGPHMGSQSGNSYPIPSRYGYLYALGTVHSMIAAGASDQSIAAELILQTSNLYQSADLTFDPNHLEAASVIPLINEFLGRMALTASTPATAHPNLAAPFQGANIQRALSPAPSPLSPRAEQWCEFYLGNAPPPVV